MKVDADHVVEPGGALRRAVGERLVAHERPARGGAADVDEAPNHRGRSNRRRGERTELLRALAANAVGPCGAQLVRLRRPRWRPGTTRRAPTQIHGAEGAARAGTMASGGALDAGAAGAWTVCPPPPHETRRARARRKKRMARRTRWHPVAVKRRRPALAGLPSAADVDRGHAQARPARPHGATERPPPALRGASVSGWRFVRAYATTFLVIASYLWLGLARARLRARVARRAASATSTRATRGASTRPSSGSRASSSRSGSSSRSWRTSCRAEFRRELEGLQDQVPPRPFDEIAARIEGELGALDERSSRRSTASPIASASLGQVHEARAQGRARVAVKVQHRDIDRIVRLDLAHHPPHHGDRAVVRPRAGARRLLPPDQGAPLRRSSTSRSRRTTSSASRRTSGRPARRLPRCPSASSRTRRVLTTTFVEGVKVERRRGASTRSASTRRTSREAPRAPLLPDDLRRRRLPRRSAPRERAGPARRRASSSSTSAPSPSSRRRCARASPSSSRGCSAATPTPRQGAAQDGLHLAHDATRRRARRSSSTSTGASRRRSARELQPEGHQDRPAARASRTSSTCAR